MKDTNEFYRDVEMLAQIDPEMQLNTALTFLYVAGRGSCTQKDLEIALGMSNGSASRNVSYWTEMKRFGVDGKDFLRREEDPLDRRYKLLTLSEKGRDFYAKMKENAYVKAGG